MKRKASDLSTPTPKRARKPVFQVIRPRPRTDPTTHTTQTRTTTLRQLQNGRLGQRKKDTAVTIPVESSAIFDNTTTDDAQVSLDETTETVTVQPRKKNTTTVSWSDIT